MPSPARDLSPRLLWVLWALALAAGLWFRIEGLSSSPLFGDEYHSARLASLPFAEILRTYDSFGTHIPLPLLQRLCTQLLGPSLLALRLPTLVSGVLALLLIYPNINNLYHHQYIQLKLVHQYQLYLYLLNHKFLLLSMIY